ncbi:hypothetical protein GCM10029992_29780 [Glycomyces albus]
MLRGALIPAVVVSAVAALALAASAPLFASADLVRLLAVFLPASVALEALLAATRGYRLMGPSVLIDKLGRTLAQLGALAVVALAGSASPAAVTAAWALPYLPAAVAAGWFLYRRRSADPRPIRASPTGSGRGRSGASRPRARSPGWRRSACSGSTSCWSRCWPGSAPPRSTPSPPGSSSSAS